MVQEEKNEEKKSIRLAFGDEKKLFEFVEMKKALLRAKTEARPETSQRTVASSNPFSRKRVVATPCNGRAVATAPVPASKRPKVVFLPNAEPAASSREAAPRQLKGLGAHKRGGYAAAEAAQALLMQKGLAEFEKVDLKHYFGSTEKEAVQSHRTSKLSEWKARSWEDDDDGTSTSMGRNELSIRKGFPKFQMRSGWG